MKASTTWSDADYEAHRSRRAAADIEGGEVPRAFDLVIPGIAGHLPPSVEGHAHTGRADRMAQADQTAGRVDRKPAAERDRAVLDRAPAFARRGDSEVIDRHVFGDREAIVH